MVKNHKIMQSNCMVLLSLPAWGAWIEIFKLGRKRLNMCVAPRMGSVDRNKRYMK